MAAGSAGDYSVDPISFANMSDEYGNVDLESDIYAVDGHSSPLQMSVSMTNTTEITLYSIVVWTWTGSAWGSATYYDISGFNAATLPSSKFGIAFNITRFGAGALPQTTTITLRNVSDGNVIVGSFTVAYNPEPV